MTTLFELASFYGVQVEWIYSAEGPDSKKLAETNMIETCLDTLAILELAEKSLAEKPDRESRKLVFAAILRMRLGGEDVTPNIAQTFYQLTFARRSKNTDFS